MKFCKTNIILLLALLLVGFVSCQKDGPVDEPSDPSDIPSDVPTDEEEQLVSNVYNPYSEKLVSYRGETITIKFDASAEWSAFLVLKTAPEKEWVAITSSATGVAKSGCSVRMAFEKNNTEEDRIVELWVEGEGYEASCIATLTQAASGTSSSAKLNETLNTYMHNILKKDYLFKDAYEKLEVDLTVNFTDFLNTHLLALGDANLEDGGYYKSSQANAGERYIYTNISEVIFLKSATKSSVAGGFGFGPFISTALDTSSDPVMGISPGYVRKGSPAEAAGIRRGDIIYQVNGVPLSTTTYLDYMNQLYQSTSGSYKFTYLRDEGGQFVTYESGYVNAATYEYNPVLYCDVIPNSSIGYLVYEAFDINSQDFLEAAVNKLKSAGITELVLDLRYNTGGAVAQSRWLAGCIAGAKNGNKTFTKAVYHDGSVEDWKFNYGYNNDTDNLGLPIDLGLSRVYVICSSFTASAAELVINSLKGIDFDIRTIGSCTEGKNVGMTVSETTVGGRIFQFSPVTFRLVNAKDDGNYKDGIQPDACVNNDNGVITDDYDYLFPYSFADWGDLDYQSALQVAVIDILSGDQDAASVRSARKASLVPVTVQPIENSHGRYGNLVYDNN